MSRRWRCTLEGIYHFALQNNRLILILVGFAKFSYLRLSYTAHAYQHEFITTHAYFGAGAHYGLLHGNTANVVAPCVSESQDMKI